MWIVQRLTTACLVFSFSLAAQEIRIARGAVDDQVFQRTSEGVATIPLAGSATGRKANGKSIEVRVTGKSGPVPGLDWIAIAKVQKGLWSGEIQRVPTGGPYKIEVRLEGAPGVNPVNQVFVGDLWILAGQSNMEGVGDLVDVQPPSELVHSFDLADNWVVAREPLHTLVSAADPVHWPANAERQPERFTGEKLERYLAERKKGAGLGLPFAVEMVKRTGVPIGLVPCAHGGTSMDQWDPALKDQGGDSLYGSMLRRFRAVGGSVKGFLWYQGESDASPKAAPAFETKFLTLIKSVRADFAQPNLPFYYVQIGRFVNSQNQTEWNAVQQAQLDSLSRASTSAGFGMAAAIDLALDDPIHVATQEHKRLARRMANLACHDLFPASANCGQLKPGPRPVSAILDRSVIKVLYSGVNGRLLADGRIAGFSIHDASGLPVPLIYKAVIDPAEASTVALYIQGKLPEHAVLHYGYGKDPYCNLRDAEDMAAPVFGPMPIAQK